MTTDEQRTDRRATRLQGPRRLRRSLVLLLSTVLAAGSLPAIAATGLAADSAEGFPGATSISQQLADPLPALNQELLFAADVIELIASNVEIETLPTGPEARRQTLLQRGMALLGTPYRWGGNSPDGGFDCSGLVGYVFRTALGIELPRVSRDMARTGERVERTKLDPGDLVFFGRRGNRVDHVGIYVGNGRFLHAPRTGRDVTVSSLDTGYWANRFLQARRVAAN